MAVVQKSKTTMNKKWVTLLFRSEQKNKNGLHKYEKSRKKTWHKSIESVWNKSRVVIDCVGFHEGQWNGCTLERKWTLHTECRVTSGAKLEPRLWLHVQQWALYHYKQSRSFHSPLTPFMLQWHTTAKVPTSSPRHNTSRQDESDNDIMSDCVKEDEAKIYIQSYP